MITRKDLTFAPIFRVLSVNFSHQYVCINLILGCAYWSRLKTKSQSVGVHLVLGGVLRTVGRDPGAPVANAVVVVPKSARPDDRFLEVASLVEEHVGGLGLEEKGEK